MISFRSFAFGLTIETVPRIALFLGGKRSLVESVLKPPKSHYNLIFPFISIFTV